MLLVFSFDHQFIQAPLLIVTFIYSIYFMNFCKFLFKCKMCVHVTMFLRVWQTKKRKSTNDAEGQVCIFILSSLDLRLYWIKIVLFPLLPFHIVISQLFHNLSFELTLVVVKP